MCALPIFVCFDPPPINPNLNKTKQTPIVITTTTNNNNNALPSTPGHITLHSFTSMPRFPLQAPVLPFSTFNLYDPARAPLQCGPDLTSTKQTKQQNLAKIQQIQTNNH